MEQRSQFKYFGRYSRFLLFRKLHIVPFVSNKHCLLYAFHGGLTLQIQLLNNYEADVHNWVHWLDLGKMGWWGALGHGGDNTLAGSPTSGLIIESRFFWIHPLGGANGECCHKIGFRVLDILPALFTACSTTDLSKPCVRGFVNFLFCLKLRENV